MAPIVLITDAFQGIGRELKILRLAVNKLEQVEQVLSVPMVEKPWDVAKAIWDAVQHKQTDVNVGSANVSLLSSKVVPDF